MLDNKYNIANKNMVLKSVLKFQISGKISFKARIFSFNYRQAQICEEGCEEINFDLTMYNTYK